MDLLAVGRPSPSLVGLQMLEKLATPRDDHPLSDTSFGSLHIAGEICDAEDTTLESDYDDHPMNDEVTAGTMMHEGEKSDFKDDVCGHRINDGDLLAATAAYLECEHSHISMDEFQQIQYGVHGSVHPPEKSLQSLPAAPGLLWHSHEPEAPARFIDDEKAHIFQAASDVLPKLSPDEIAEKVDALTWGIESEGSFKNIDDLKDLCIHEHTAELFADVPYEYQPRQIPPSEKVFFSREDDRSRCSIRFLAGLDASAAAKSSTLTSVYLQAADSEVRRHLLQSLASLPSQDLLCRVSQVAPCLYDSVKEVRLAALEVFKQLAAESLAKWAMSIAERLQDNDIAVRVAALSVISCLEPHHLAAHDVFLWQLLDGNTLLHLAVECGYFTKVPQVGTSTRHLQRYLFVQNTGGVTPLHLAASKGCLTSCQALLRLGALIRLTNSAGDTPLAGARANGHRMVAAYLEDLESPFAMVRGGAADTFSLAMSDTRPVVGVQWYTLDLTGVAGMAGAIHSIVAVTVGMASAQSFDTYVIEKSAPSQGEAEASHNLERCRNGVSVSRWSEVMPNITRQPIHVLDSSDIRNNTGNRELCIRTLRQIAVDLGPYNAGNCNCHHAARAIFNSCARRNARVKSVPNAILSVVPMIMHAVGLNFQVPAIVSL
jgi:hypothetical protein